MTLTIVEYHAVLYFRETYHMLLNLGKYASTCSVSGQGTYVQDLGESQRPPGGKIKQKHKICPLSNDFKKMLISTAL